MKRRKFLGGFNRVRLMLTLGLAVLLPAAALIFVNFLELRSFDRDKLLEAAIHRDFQEVLAITEKSMNKKAYAMVEEARELFPSPDSDASEKEEKLDLVLARSPWLTHALLFDEKGYVLRSQPGQMQDKYVRDEHERMAEGYHAWLSLDGKSVVRNINKRSHQILFNNGETKRADGPAFLGT